MFQIFCQWRKKTNPQKVFAHWMINQPHVFMCSFPSFCWLPWKQQKHREGELMWKRSYAFIQVMWIQIIFTVYFFCIYWCQGIMTDKTYSPESELSSKFEEWNEPAKTSVMEKLIHLPILQRVSCGFSFAFSFFEFAWIIFQPTFCWFLMS